MRQRCGGLNLKERDRFAEIGADGNRIFKYFLNKLDDRVGTVLAWQE